MTRLTPEGDPKPGSGNSVEVVAAPSRLTLRQWVETAAKGIGAALAGFGLLYFAAFVVSQHVWS